MCTDAQDRTLPTWFAKPITSQGHRNYGSSCATCCQNMPHCTGCVAPRAAEVVHGRHRAHGQRRSILVPARLPWSVHVFNGARILRIDVRTIMTTKHRHTICMPPKLHCATGSFRVFAGPDLPQGGHGRCLRGTHVDQAWQLSTCSIHGGTPGFFKVHAKGDGVCRTPHEHGRGQNVANKPNPAGTVCGSKSRWKNGCQSGWDFRNDTGRGEIVGATGTTGKGGTTHHVFARIRRTKAGAAERNIMCREPAKEHLCVVL